MEQNRITTQTHLRRKILPTLLLSLLLPLLSQCATASAGIAVSNIPLENRKFEVVGPAQTDLNWYTIDLGLLGIPLEEPPVDRAVRNLLDEKKGDALINIRYSTDRIVLLFITINRLHMRADVVKLEDEDASRAGRKGK